MPVNPKTPVGAADEFEPDHLDEHDASTCDTCLANDDEWACPHCGADTTEIHDEKCPFFEHDVDPMEGGCDTCGAPPGMPCDPRCTSTKQHDEGFSFDKFMAGTLLKESHKRTVHAKNDSPQRQLARNYQEHPNGKTRMGGK